MRGETKKILVLMLLVSSLSFSKPWDVGVWQVKDVISTMLKDPGSVEYYNWYKATIYDGTKL